MVVSRIYFRSTGAPGISPAIGGSWEQAAATAFQRLKCGLVKSNTSLADFSDIAFITPTTGQTCLIQFIGPAVLVDQTISGNVSIVVRGSEGAASANLYLAFGIRWVSPDGLTVRGTSKFQGTNSGGSEYGTANQTRIWSAVALTNVNVLAGDLPVIEIGWHGASPAAGSTGLLRFGDETGKADFALTTGLTTDLDPWLEFDTTITWGDPVIPLGVGECDCLAEVYGALVPLGVGECQAIAAPAAVGALLAPGVGECNAIAQPAAAAPGALEPLGVGECALIAQPAAVGALLPLGAGECALLAVLAGTGATQGLCAGEGVGFAVCAAVGALVGLSHGEGLGFALCNAGGNGEPFAIGECQTIASLAGTGALRPLGAGEAVCLAPSSALAASSGLCAGEAHCLAAPSAVGALRPLGAGEAVCLAFPFTPANVSGLTIGECFAIAQAFEVHGLEGFCVCEPICALYPQRGRALINARGSPRRELVTRQEIGSTPVLGNFPLSLTAPGFLE